MLFNRYGIYMTPETGNFANLGAEWLGWNVEAGHAVPHPTEIEGALIGATQTPRKYGFHGTIKPPFHLSHGETYENLLAKSTQLCAHCAPITVDALEISALGPFLAIIPRGNLHSLSALSATILQGLDEFRAPASEDELARRRKADLTPLQETNLKNWGYPYVLDAFKFHMTLSGPLPKDELKTLHSLAEKHFAPALDTPITIRSLALVGEAGDGRFHTLHRLPLLGKTKAPR